MYSSSTSSTIMWGYLCVCPEKKTLRSLDGSLLPEGGKNTPFVSTFLGTDAVDKKA